MISWFLSWDYLNGWQHGKWVNCTSSTLSSCFFFPVLLSRMVPWVCETMRQTMRHFSVLSDHVDTNRVWERLYWKLNNLRIRKNVSQVLRDTTETSKSLWLNHVILCCDGEQTCWKGTRRLNIDSSFIKTCFRIWLDILHCCWTNIYCFTTIIKVFFLHWVQYSSATIFLSLPLSLFFLLLDFKSVNNEFKMYWNGSPVDPLGFML